MNNDNYWIEYLTPELLYEFVKEHFEKGTYAPTLEEFKKSIVEPCIKNGYSKQVNLLKGKNKGNFYACLLFSDYECKLVSKNNFVVFKGEREHKNPKVYAENCRLMLNTDYVNLMINTCGANYLLGAKLAYSIKRRQIQQNHQDEIRKVMNQLTQKQKKELETFDNRTKAIFKNAFKKENPKLD